MTIAQNFSATPLRRITLVTGASSGIGRAVALALARAGAFVVATGRSRERLAKLADELAGQGEALPLDVSEPDDIARFMRSVGERHGRIDALVVNAGVSPNIEIDALTVAEYQSLMDVNVRGAVFTFAHALPFLSEGASVVFVGSVAARKGQPGDAVYAGSKGFVRAFARSLGTSPDLMKRRIRVNVVSPGPIETPFTEEATRTPEAKVYVENLIPMRRWGQDAEVAQAVLFLLSEASSFTTGADLTVDGGMSHV